MRTPIIPFSISLLLAVRAVAAQLPEAAVRRRCGQLTSRINAHDLAGIRGCFSPQLKIRGSRGTPQSYRQVLLSMGKTFQQYPRFRTSMDVRKVAIRGDKAYLTAEYKNTGIQRKPETGICTMVWKRVGPTWRLVLMDRG